MRVNDSNLTGVTSPESQRTTQTGEASATGRGGNIRTTSGHSGDTVEFSTSLDSLSRAMSSMGADRAERIQQLTAQYQNGTYQPDSVLTARGMIAESLAAGAA